MHGLVQWNGSKRPFAILHTYNEPKMICFALLKEMKKMCGVLENIGIFRGIFVPGFMDKQRNLNTHWMYSFSLLGPRQAIHLGQWPWSCILVPPKLQILGNKDSLGNSRSAAGAAYPGDTSASQLPSWLGGSRCWCACVCWKVDVKCMGAFIFWVVISSSHFPSLDPWESILAEWLRRNPGIRLNGKIQLR